MAFHSEQTATFSEDCFYAQIYKALVVCSAVKTWIFKYELKHFFQDYITVIVLYCYSVNNCLIYFYFYLSLGILREASEIDT